MDTSSLYQLFLKHPVVTTDSRNIPVSSIFFALKGENFDGNAFAEDALAKGAAYAVVDKRPNTENDRLILVPDVLTALQNLARYHRDRLGIPILAITGSNGKTTTKELVAAVLAKKFQVNFTKGNLNNHIGVPLTLLSMDENCEFGVVEMGANHPGEIKVLAEIANPDFGMITNVGKAHLEGFGSFEGVIRTKSELYDFIRNKKGKCFVNADNPILSTQANGIDQIIYDNSWSCNLNGEPVSSGNNLVVKALFPKGLLYLKSKLIGDYNFENILAAACIGKYFDVDPLLIEQAIAEYEPSNNRSQLIKSSRNTIIMDAYNANPTSMMAALKNFANIKAEEKCVILGDMLELGDSSYERLPPIVDFLQNTAFNLRLIFGPKFFCIVYRTKKEKFNNVELLSNYLKTQPIENKFILVKGSRGIHLERVLEMIA